MRLQPLRLSLDREVEALNGIKKRQVFDLAERALVVTEHQALLYRCENCQCETKAAFPGGVVSPVQYGERVNGAAIYLNIQQLTPRIGPPRR